MTKIALLVSKLKAEFANIKFKKVLFENYGIQCFDTKEDVSLLYLEIFLIENISHLKLGPDKLSRVALRDYESLYVNGKIYIDLVPKIKPDIQVIIKADDWDSLNW
jgi:hypothetical protein